MAKTTAATRTREDLRGREWRTLAATAKRVLPWQCARCGLPIEKGLPTNDPGAITVDHLDAVGPGGATRKLSLADVALAHRGCNSRAGQAAKARKRSGLPPVSSKARRAAAPVEAVRPTPGPEFEVPWLLDLLDVPEDATWPRLMTAPHPRAVGSIGHEVEAFSIEQLGVTLRWWQRLSIRRQLEVDSEGRLVWYEVIESTPRRAGKSVRLRTVALWRMLALRYAEDQLVMFTGKDLPVLKEIHRAAWYWAQARGYRLGRTNGQEEIEALREDGRLGRWLVRGKDSTYGYSATLGLVDEAWAVAESVVADGLEPSLLERIEPQLVLTSTAHRKATGLMRTRIADATEYLAGGDERTLLMLWGADPKTDPADRAAWRHASPIWTPEREALMEKQYRRVVAGETLDPDEASPLESFRAQYLNIWPKSGKAVHEGWLPLDEWRDTTGSIPRYPIVGALESDMGGHYATAVGWLDERGVAHVNVEPASTLGQAVSLLTRSGVDTVAMHRATRARLEAPVWPVQVLGSAEATAATGALSEAVQGGRLLWRGDLFSEQMGHAVVMPVQGGSMLNQTKSRGPINSVKAVSWVVWVLESAIVESSAVY